MAQDATAAFKALAEDSARTIRYVFKVDWEGDGFSDTSTWTAESAYVKTVRGDMQGTNYAHSIAAVGKSVSDVVYVTCENPMVTGGDGNDTLRFSQTNSNGPLYAYIGGGKIYMTRAVLWMGFYGVTGPGGDPTTITLRQITGYIVDAKENYGQREITFEIRDRAAVLALTQVSGALYEDTNSKDYMEALCALAERDIVSSADQDFDQGMVVTPYMWLDNETLWEEMSILAESQLGRVWFDKDGDLHFDDGGHFVNSDANSYDDPTVSQATLTVSSFKDCSPRVDTDGVYNHIVVEYSPYYVGQEQAVHTASDTLVILPTLDGTAHPITHRIETQYPVTSMTMPSAAADTLVAVTAGGTDMSSSVTVTLVSSGAMFAEYTITNTNTEFTAYVTKLEVIGYPLLSGNVASYEAEDTTSITQFGRKTWTVRNPYIQTRRHAEMVGDFMLSRYKAPVNHLTIRGIPARPWLEVGDLVTVVEDLTGINLVCFIGRIEWSFSARDPRYTQTLHVMPRADLFTYTNYFIIGTSRYGTGTGRGRLFW